MRKLLAVLLMAGVATPALAGPADIIRRQADREARQEAKAEARSERAAGNERARGERSGNDRSAERPRFNRADNAGGQDRPVMRVERGNGGQEAEARGRFVRSERSGGGEQPALQPGGNAQPADSVRNWRGPRVVEAPPPTIEDRAGPTLRQQARPLPRVLRNRVPVVSNTPREGTQPPLRVERRRGDTVQWSTSHWRKDKRYDWRDWRRKNRSIFRIGIYYDPFGWNYRPYSIGWRLWPSYYGSRYWIHDPWRYRLPYAPPGYRWIRYYDDALLVDTWNGRVVDVIYNFFW